MKEFLKKHKKIIIAFVATLIFFLSLCTVEYGRPTFRMYVNDADVEFVHFLEYGRYIIALWWKIVSIIGCTLTQTYYISYIMALVFMALSIYKTEKIVHKLIVKENESTIKQDILITLISILIALNPFTIELFLYLEKGCMVMAMFFAIWASEFMLKYFDEKKKINIFYTFILIAISAFTYQGVTVMYLAFTLVFAIYYAKNFGSFILNNIIHLIPFLIGYGSNYICLKLLFDNGSRVAESINLVENFKVIISKLSDVLIDNCGVMPEYTMLIFTVLVFVILCINVVINKKEKWNILAYIYLYIGVLAIILVPQVALKASSISLCARVSVAFGGVVGIILMFALSQTNLNKQLSYLLIAIITIYLLIELVYMTMIISDHYKTNELDFQTVNAIQEKIDEYEAQSGNIITKIVYYSDSDVTYAYPDIIYYDQINSKIASFSGANLYLLEYASARLYEESSDINEEYKEYFLSNDWDYFSEEQLIFDGDTLHLCTF